MAAEVKKIYFDMDGVFADFERGVEELCGIQPVDQEKKSCEQDDFMWEKIRETGHIYDRLELMSGAEQLFDAVYGKYGSRCEILTGIPKPGRGILIDDLRKNIRAWEDHGGTGIMHTDAMHTIEVLREMDVL